MSTILGINPERQQPAASRYVAVDWDRWHYRLVLYECIEAELEKERRLGTATVPDQCKVLRRRGGGPEVHVRGKQGDAEVSEIRSVLVKARVVTAAASELMTKRELRAAMLDLRARLEACAGIGVGMEEEGT